MKRTQGEKTNCLTKLFCPTQYCTAISTVLMHKPIKKTPLREAQGLGAQCSALRTFAHTSMTVNRKQGTWAHGSWLRAHFGWEAARLSFAAQV